MPDVPLDSLRPPRRPTCPQALSRNIGRHAGDTAYQDADFRAFADLYDGPYRQHGFGMRSSTSITLPGIAPTRRHRVDRVCRNVAAGGPAAADRMGRELLGIALARAQGVKALLDSGAAIAARDEKADAAYTAVIKL